MFLFLIDITIKTPTTRTLPGKLLTACTLTIGLRSEKEIRKKI